MTLDLDAIRKRAEASSIDVFMLADDVLALLDELNGRGLTKDARNALLVENAALKDVNDDCGRRIGDLMDEVDRLKARLEAVHKQQCDEEHEYSEAIDENIKLKAENAKLRAVAEAARMLQEMLDEQYGMDKSELTHVRWTLAALDAKETP